MIGMQQTPKPKKNNGCLIAAIALFTLVIIVVVAIVAALSTVDYENLSVDESDIDFSNTIWVSKAEDAAKNYMNERYGGGSDLLYDAVHERAWFVEFEYDYSADEVYKSNDFVHGYYVCEGVIKYDIPGDGSTELYPVNYTTTVYVTDNANDYRFCLRTITLTFDGIEIESYQNPEFFTQ